MNLIDLEAEPAQLAQLPSDDVVEHAGLRDLHLLRIHVYSQILVLSALVSVKYLLVGHVDVENKGTLGSSLLQTAGLSSHLRLVES